jgi:hypothetical protein
MLQKDVSLQPGWLLHAAVIGVMAQQNKPLGNYFTVLPDEEIWQTGSPPNGPNVLKSIRQTVNRPKHWNGCSKPGRRKMPQVKWICLKHENKCGR